MGKSFRLCAEHYLKQWCDYDREFFLGFSGGFVTCGLLREMCLKYGVDRTVPGRGPEKYRQFVEMLNRYQNTEMARQDVPKIIEKELLKMREAYGSSFLSAITKAFWMMKRHPVVIYDSKARRGLRHYGLPPGDKDYRVYFDSWFSFFERDDTKHGLNDAMSWLRNLPNLRKRRKLSKNELEEITGSEWFRNRVADMRLFYSMHQAEPRN
jgi:hypothetical protein